MDYTALEREGERQQQQFLADMEKATIEQITKANRQTEIHMNEYSHSFANNLHKEITA